MEIFGHSVSALLSIDNLGHILLFASSTFALIAFLMTNITLLRSFIIIANILSVIAGYQFDNGSMIFWGYFFTSLNMVMIIHEMLQKIPLLLPDNLKKLYPSVQDWMTTREFTKLIKHADFITASADNLLISENEKFKGLFMISSGNLSVTVNGEKVGDILAGDFAGEISFAFTKEATATVVTNTEVSYFFWSPDSLMTIERRKKVLYDKLFKSISYSVVKKLKLSNTTQ